MDERFRGKELWIGLGALGIVFLCVMLCGMGAFMTLVSRPGPVHMPVPQVQPPTGDGSVAPPPATYYGYGPMGAPRFGGFSFIGGLFRLAFAGLLLLMFIGLIKRIFWGRRRWGYHHCGPGGKMHGPWSPHYKGGPPGGKEWKGKPHAGWGPWGWHEAYDQPEEGATDAQADTPAEETEYTGPQE
jgi:hypothetical protein